MQIQWLDYIYSNAKMKLFDVIRSYNMPLPSSLEETYECVDVLIDQYGDDAEKKLLKCFPEYSGIAKIAKEEAGTQRGSAYHNFAGEEAVEQKLSKLEQKIGLDNCRSELEQMKRNQTFLLIAVGILIVTQLKK